MRGFLAAAEGFHGPRLLEELVEGTCEMHIMLTYPDIADRRDVQRSNSWMLEVQSAS